MLPKIVPKFSNTRHFGYPKIQVQVLGNLLYPIIMLLIVKKVNQGQREQIRALIMHANLSDSKRTSILDEQSSRDRNPCLVIFENNI
jgi:hypothetical protein